jgi:hypothetical protein
MCAWGAMQPIMNVTLISWDRDLCLLCWEMPTEVIKQSWSPGAVEPVKTPKFPGTSATCRSWMYRVPLSHAQRDAI